MIFLTCIFYDNDIINRTGNKNDSSVSFVSKKNYIPYPMKVDLFNNIEIKDIALAPSHLIVLDMKGNVYVAGDNSKGQLGLGQTVPFV